MNDIRKFLNIIAEAEPEIKKAVIDLVKNTDDGALLTKVLNTLKAGNIDERIVAVVGKDPDASKFVKQIANVIVSMDFPIESKDAFLEKYPKGIIDIGKLLDGNPHSFSELVSNDEFSKELFKLLTTTLVSQGVGPGEVALAAFHPSIQWSGRTAGGGDIIVGTRAVEVKTSVASGGRWINPRKAKMNLPRVLEALRDATGIETWPDRVNASVWCNDIVTTIKETNPSKLNSTCEIIASSIFNSTDTTAYAKALASGDLKTVIDEHLRTGFDNYKAVSNFEGILLMDVRTETAQYFIDYDSMQGHIKSDAVYIYAPEGEIMPKVTLLPVPGVSAVAPKPEKSVKAASIAAPKDPGASLSADAIKRPGTVKSAKKSAGDREKR